MMFLCGKVEMTRQNYYKERKKKERRLWPRLDGRKVFHMPAPELARHGIKLDRGQVLRRTAGTRAFA
ncbi:MAG: hypothetical protein Pg6C_03830 [Treponemataceae bacterium]|nr:MAG: hypothetical protein Pg6C_03830 [Treponemataceae bacterium]